MKNKSLIQYSYSKNISAKCYFFFLPIIESAKYLMPEIEGDQSTEYIILHNSNALNRFIHIALIKCHS